MRRSARKYGQLSYKSLYAHCLIPRYEWILGLPYRYGRFWNFFTARSQGWVSFGRQRIQRNAHGR